MANSFASFSLWEIIKMNQVGKQQNIETFPKWYWTCFYHPRSKCQTSMSTASTSDRAVSLSSAASALSAQKLCIKLGQWKTGAQMGPRLLRLRRPWRHTPRSPGFQGSVTLLHHTILCCEMCAPKLGRTTSRMNHMCKVPNPTFDLETKMHCAPCRAGTLGCITADRHVF